MDLGLNGMNVLITGGSLHGRFGAWAFSHRRQYHDGRCFVACRGLGELYDLRRAQLRDARAIDAGMRQSFTTWLAMRISPSFGWRSVAAVVRHAVTS